MEMYLNSNQNDGGSTPLGASWTPWAYNRIASKGDYNYAVIWEHPFCTKNGYVLEHRIVMENKLGRLLDRKEIVHHINENKKDNRPENLEVMGKTAHGRHHKHGVISKWVLLRCPGCGNNFHRRKNQTHLVKGGIFDSCSKTCRSKFWTPIQYGGMTEEDKLAIAQNVIKEYSKTFSAGLM